jgi:hypothetical protein
MNLGALHLNRQRGARAKPPCSHVSGICIGGSATRWKVACSTRSSHELETEQNNQYLTIDSTIRAGAPTSAFTSSPRSYLGALSFAFSTPTAKMMSLLLTIKSILIVRTKCGCHTLLVKKYQSFIDEDSNQPVTESILTFEPWNVIGGCP